MSSNTVLAMDGMHNHDSNNHNKHQDMTYVDGSKTKISDEMFSSFSAGLSNTQIVICLLYTSPSPRDLSTSRMPSSA